MRKNMLFLTLLLVGVAIYKDYGLTTDETGNRLHGLVTAKYVNEKCKNPFPYIGSSPEIPKLNAFPDRDHSSFTPTLLIFGEMAYGFWHNDFTHFEKADGYFMNAEIHYLRHLINFLLFWLSLIFFYKIIQRRWNNESLSILGVLMLFLSPRIFAESFYNINDVGLLSLTIIYAYTLLSLIEKPNLKNTFWNTVLIGMIIATRIVGVICVPVSLSVFLYLFLFQRQKLGFSKAISGVFIFGILASLSIVAFWPFLWEAPLENFLFSFKNMSKFRWGGNLFYLGHFVPAPNRPWHYPLVWMLVTIPIAYLALFFVGVFDFAKRTITQIWKWKLEENTFQDILFFGLWFAPITAVIVLKSVVYDGWRHLYFTYPFFLLMAIGGLKQIFVFFEGRTFIKIVVVTALLLPNIWFIVKNHPNQQVYFNELVQNPDKTFELDYWGASFAQGLRFIAETDQRDTVKVKMDVLGILNHNLLPEQDKKRLQLVSSIKDADYYLTHYRGFPNGDSLTFNPNVVDMKQFPFQHEVFQVKSGRAKILGVYRLN